MRKSVYAFVLSAALAVSAFAADVTGKWQAEMKTPNGDSRQVTFNLKADGSKLTGNMSTQMGDMEISDGKVDGDNVSFVVKMEFNGNSRTMNYKGKVAGDELKLQVESPRGTREMTAKRVNPS